MSPKHWASVAARIAQTADDSGCDWSENLTIAERLAVMDAMLTEESK
jgi:hypothetical protein